jgi:hypothetical protein
MVSSILTDNISSFLMLVCILVFGFAIFFKTLIPDDKWFGGEPMQVFLVLLSWGLLGEHDLDSVAENYAAFFMFVLFGILLQVILLNMLIAIISDTYDRVKDKSRSEIHKLKAKIILELEALYNPETSYKQGQHFIHVLVRSAGRPIPRKMAITGWHGGSDSGGNQWDGRMAETVRRVEGSIEGLSNDMQSTLEVQNYELHREVANLKHLIQMQSRDRIGDQRMAPSGQ